MSISQTQSMQDALSRNPSVVASMVVQARRNKKSENETFVFVEGPSDRNAYVPFAGAGTTFIVAHGRDNVSGCVRLVEAQCESGVYGIEDADCDRALRKTLVSGAVFLTDGHDMEAMMLRSPALEKVLRELGDVDRIAEYEQKHCSVRDALLGAARPLGIAKYLKLIGELKGVNLDARNLPYAEFIDTQSLAINEEALSNHLATTSGGRTSKEDITQLLASTDLSHVEDWDVCRGHDLVAILALGLSSAFGTRSLKPYIVEQSLRLAFDSVAFCQTQLCKKIVEAESKDSEGLKVLSDEVRLVCAALRNTT